MNTRIISVRRSRAICRSSFRYTASTPRMHDRPRRLLDHVEEDVFERRGHFRDRCVMATSADRSCAASGIEIGGGLARARRARRCRTGWSSRLAATPSSARISATGSGPRTSTMRRVGEHLLDLARRADRRERAGVDQRDAVAALGFVQIVGGDQHGDARLREHVDQAPELAPRQRIDAAGRLVEEQDRRLVEDRAAERQPLPPAAGEVARQRRLAAAQAGHLDHELAARGERRAGQPVDAAPERDVLIDGEQLVQREPLRHVADALLDAFGIAASRRCRRPVAVPRRRAQQPAQHADGGGLAGAVAAEEAEDLAAPRRRRTGRPRRRTRRTAASGRGLRWHCPVSCPRCVSTSQSVRSLDVSRGRGPGRRRACARRALAIARVRSSSACSTRSVRRAPRCWWRRRR